MSTIILNSRLRIGYFDGDENCDVDMYYTNDTYDMCYMYEYSTSMSCPDIFYICKNW